MPHGGLSVAKEWAHTTMDDVTYLGDASLRNVSHRAKLGSASGYGKVHKANPTLGSTSTSAFPWQEDDEAEEHDHGSARPAPPRLHTHGGGVAIPPRRPGKEQNNSGHYTFGNPFQPFARSPFDVTDQVRGIKGVNSSSQRPPTHVERNARKQTAVSGQEEVQAKSAARSAPFNLVIPGLDSTAFFTPGTSSYALRLAGNDKARHNMVHGQTRGRGVLKGTFQPRNSLGQQSSSPLAQRTPASTISTLIDEDSGSADDHPPRKRAKVAGEPFTTGDAGQLKVGVNGLYSGPVGTQSVSSMGSLQRRAPNALTVRRDHDPFACDEYNTVEEIVGFKNRKVRPAVNRPKRGRPSDEASHGVMLLDGPPGRRESISSDQGSIRIMEGGGHDVKRHDNKVTESSSRPKSIWIPDEFSPPNMLARKSNEQTRATEDRGSRTSGITISKPKIIDGLRKNSSFIMLDSDALKPDKSSCERAIAVEDVDLDEDSIDLLKPSAQTPDVDEFEVRRTMRNPNFSRNDETPLSRSVSQKGDIPPSTLTTHRTLRKSSKNAKDRTMSYKMAYLRSGSQVLSDDWEDMPPIQLHYNDSAEQFDLVVNSEAMSNLLSSFVIKPAKIFKVLYNPDNPKLYIHRSMDATQPGSSKLIMQTCEAGDAAELAEFLRRLKPDIKLLRIGSDELNAKFKHEKELYAKVKRPVDTPGSDEIALLEARETRRGRPEAVPIGSRHRTSAENGAEDPRSGRTRSRTTLVSQMRGALEEEEDDHAKVTPATRRRHDPPAAESTTILDAIRDGFRPTTRASSQREPNDGQARPRRLRSPSPPKWTRSNPDWITERNWRTSLTYPLVGKQRTIVDARDIERLDDGEFLNDNLIAFYLRYLEVQLEMASPALAKRIYFKNTFFYEALIKGKSKGGPINYDAVKSWTNRVDLFSYDYIIVPVCENLHWYAAIICNVPELLRRDDGDLEEIPPPAEMAVAEEMDRASPAISKDAGQSPSSAIDVSGDSENQSVEENAAHKQTTPELPLVTSQVEHMSLDDGNNGRSERDSELQEKENKAESDTNAHPAESTLSSRTAGKTRRLKRRSSIQPRKYDPNAPRIITLDSLGGSHSPTCSNLRDYLKAEAKAKRDNDIEIQGSIGTTATGLQQQSNFCDCGIFLLAYIKKFLEDPDKFTQSILQRDPDLLGNWEHIGASKMRGEIRDLIFRLYDEMPQKGKMIRKPKAVAESSAKAESIAADSAQQQASLATLSGQDSEMSTPEPGESLFKQFVKRPASPPPPQERRRRLVQYGKGEKQKAVEDTEDVTPVTNRGRTKPTSLLSVESAEDMLV
jgi:hypothetical protein